MKKEDLVILGSLAAVLLIVFALIVPAINSLGDTKAALSQQKDLLAATKEFADRMSGLNEEYQKNIEEVEKITSALPQEQDLPDLLVQLETLATASGLIMDSVGFEEVQKKASVAAPLITSEDILPEGSSESSSQESESKTSGSYKTLLVSLKLSGAYNSFKNYLQVLEKNLRLMDISFISFSSQSGQEITSAILFYQVSVMVYYQ